MLFSKKKVYAIGEKLYKEQLKNKEDEILVKINLRIPQIQCPKKDPLLKNAVPFYEKLGNSLYEFSKTELFHTASILKKSDNESFQPFGAVALYEITEDSEDYLSVLIDFSVSDGISSPITERKTQIWNKKTGLLCRLSDFVDSKTIESIIGKEKRKRWQKDLFIRSDGKIKTFLKTKNEFEEILLEAQSENGIN